MSYNDQDRRPISQALAELGVSASNHRQTIPLLKADPHKWGQGQIHQIDPERDTTLCGQTPARCPGTQFHGSEDQITCKGCIRSIESRRQAAIRAQAFEAEREQREAEYEERETIWWDHYTHYLDYHPAWKRKRRLVLERENYRCEGCKERRATQAHHRRGTYPRGCLPGSPQWIRKEKLFDLIALCDTCHVDVHDD